MLHTLAVLTWVSTPRHASPRASAAPAVDAIEDLAALRNTYDAQRAQATAQREQAQTTNDRLAALGSARDRLWPLPPRLKPHDISVVTLDGALTADALDRLLSHRCCAVHVRGFIPVDTCTEIASRLDGCSGFSNWNIHQATSSRATFTATDVAKLGVTSGEALESWEQFCQYLLPSVTSLDALLPGPLNPFTKLRSELDELHQDGCRRRRLGRWSLPVGTIRRMRRSMGLIHADTSTLLAHEAGEFSANLYIQTPPGRGALSVYRATTRTIHHALPATSTEARAHSRCPGGSMHVEYTAPMTR